MEIYGLARSGNHAVIFWILHNLADSFVELERHQIYVSGDICFINNCHHHHSPFRSSFDVSPYSFVLRSYEDIDCASGGFVVVRDFMNLVCSRYRAYGSRMAFRDHYCAGLENVISLWKIHALCSSAIFYNKWLVSRDYRDLVGDMVGVPNVRDKTDYVCSISPSSFGMRGGYLSRNKLIKLPSSMVEVILSDAELVRMNKEMFGVDLGDLE
jgi:hypothetical protein